MSSAEDEEVVEVSIEYTKIKVDASDSAYEMKKDLPDVSSGFYAFAQEVSMSGMDSGF